MSLLKNLACILALLSTCHIESLEMIAAQREGDGVGYKNQYSKFSIYHAFENSSWQPFIDARYLLLNHGKNGANLGTGLGYQFEKENRLTGYAYFDLTESKTDHYFNQITAGLSYTHPLLVSGKDYGEFTCYFNGYFPIKNREKNVKAPSFAKFKGNHLLINQTDRLALTGTNLELGYLSSYWKDFNIYVAGSGYYFEKSSLDAFGGYGKLRVTYNELIHAEVMVSGDRLFGTNVSGTVGIRIPLDCKGMKAVKTKTPRKHRLRPVERFEPMILDTEKRKVVAKDSCGKALNYIFVNNLCGSCGTIESPFGTLLDAQNASQPGDTIYVFRGDGTTSGMDMGMVMKDNQTLAGSGSPLAVNTNLGPIIIPKLTALRPRITNTVNDGITLARNNTISGIIIDGAADHGIFLSSTTLGKSTINIFATDSINNTTWGAAFNATDPLTLNISNSNFSNNSGSGLFASFESKSSVCISHSNFNMNTLHGIDLQPNGTQLSTVSLLNSNFSSNEGSGLFSIFLSPIILTANNCNFNNNSIPGMSIGSGAFVIKVCINNSNFKNNLLGFRHFLDSSDASVLISNSIFKNNEDTNAQLLVEKSQITCKVTNCVFNDGLGRGFEVQEFSVSEIDLLMQNCSAINNVINGFEVNMSNGTLNAVLNDCEAKSNQATGYVISSPIPISGQINCCIGTENSIANFNISDTTNTILIVDDTKLTTSL